MSEWQGQIGHGSPCIGDCVVRMDNGNREMSQDPGLPVQLEAFTSYGRSLWRKDVCRHDHCFGSANNVPFNVWDMNADGKAEIITRLQIDDAVYVAILDGMSGRLRFKCPWPWRKMPERNLKYFHGFRDQTLDP